MYRMPGMYDKMFYYQFSENESGSIVMNIELKSPVDKDALDRALSKALKRNGAFRLSAFIDEAGNLLFDDNMRKAEIYELDSRCVLWGTDEVNGYLFRVMAGGCRIVIEVFHGITDGRGMLEFSKTLLYFYFTTLGHEINPEGKVLTDKTPVHYTEMADTMRLYAEPGHKPYFNVDTQKKIFSIPEQRFPLDSAAHTRLIQFHFNTGDFMAVSRRARSTFTAVLSVIIGNAMNKLYSGRRDLIMMDSAIDVRPFYDNHTLSNFVELFKIPFPDSMFELDPDSQARLAHDYVMRIQINRENFDYKIYETWKLRNRIYRGPLTDRTALRGFREGFWNAHDHISTFFTTNVGPCHMPSEMESLVEYADMYVSAMVYHPLFSVLSHRGRSVVTLIQRFESDALAKAVSKELKENGIENRMVERGYFEDNKLFFDKLPRTYASLR